MSEKPILCNAQVVRAILDDRQTQDRRPIPHIIPEWQLNPIMDRVYTGVLDTDDLPWRCHFRIGNVGKFGVFTQGQVAVDDYVTTFRPSPWQPGDTLYVRETFATAPKPGKPDCVPSEQTDKTHFCLYRADFKPGYGVTWQWRPSIHMPKWASRIKLRVLRPLWVERVQDISEADAYAEGLGHDPKLPHPIDWFRDLWDSLYKAKGYGWDANPWVWCTEFERIEP